MRRITDILKQPAGPIPSVPAGPHITIRHAHPADADALAVLAKLDSSHPPHGAILVAEAGGELWAAVSLDDSHLIANPFRPTGELAFNLLARARQLRRAERRRARRTANARKGRTVRSDPQARVKKFRRLARDATLRRSRSRGRA